MVYLFLAEGFEEVEAIAPLDLLIRAGVDVKTVSMVANRRAVCGARGIPIMSDITINEVDFDNAEMLILPGGAPGTDNLASDDFLMKKVDEAVENGRKVAAICAAPAKILGARGHLRAREATCYPGLEYLMKEAIAVTDKVVTDGNITTSRGLGTAVEFGLEIVRILCGKEKADSLRTSVVAD